MTTVVASSASGLDVEAVAVQVSRRTLRVSGSTLALAVLSASVVAAALDALVDNGVLAPVLRGGWAELVAPALVAVVLGAAVCERLWPAEERPLLARGHVQDAAWFAFHVGAIVPFMTLLSVGSAVVLGSRFHWLQAGWTASWPRWSVVLATLVAMDLCNWLAHVADHKVGALWRLHALHHSQSELNVLTSFRAHPLMHTTGFLLATVPVLVLTGDQPLAAVLITAYVCLGTLPHANVRWTYGPLGYLLVSPAYHRRHHSVERQDMNLGVVLTVWDVLSKRARFPVRGEKPCPTGLPPCAVPLEQDSERSRPGRLLAKQLVQPFRR